MKKFFALLMLILIVSILSTACKKNSSSKKNNSNVSLPTVTTAAITEITTTTATGGGNVTSDGGADVTAAGICWAETANPTLSGKSTNNGTGMGSFTSLLTGLTLDTKYYVRAYATNSTGTAYGDVQAFTTGLGDAVHASGSVILPTGTSLTTSDVTVHGLLKTVTVQADGTYTIPEAGAGPTLVNLCDASGNIMLMGFADSEDPEMGEISPLSTAAILMFYGINAYTLPSETWQETLELIKSEQKVKDLAAVIESRLAADSAALQNGDQAIQDAIIAASAVLTSSAQTTAASKKILASSKTLSSNASGAAFTIAVSNPLKVKAAATDPIEITIPDSNLSGIQVSASDSGDGIVLTNSYRRHCYYWVYYAGYQDESGTDHMLSSALWELKDSAYLKSTNALSGVVGTSIDYAWGKIPYIPVKTDTIALDTMPSDAQKAYYKVIVVGGTTWINYLPPDWLDDNVNRLTYIEYQNLMGQITVIKDFIMPTVFVMAPVGKLNSYTGKQLGDFCAGMIGIVTKGGVNATLNAVDQKYSDIAWTILKAVVSEGSIRNGMIEHVGKALLGAALTEQAIKDVGSTAKVLVDAMKSCDKLMLAVDLGAVCKDTALSKGYEYFDVTAVRPDVHIEPSAATVTAGAEKTFNVIKGTVTGDTFEYHWVVTGGNGSLRKSDGTTLANEQTTSENSIVYKASADAADKAEDTLTVDVYRKQITDAGVVTQLIGSDEAVVTISKSMSIPVTEHYIEPVYKYNSVDNKYYYCRGSYETWQKIDGAIAYDICYHNVKNYYGGYLPDITGRIQLSSLVFRYFPNDDLPESFLNELFANPEVSADIVIRGGVQTTDLSYDPTTEPGSGYWAYLLDVLYFDKEKYDEAVITVTPVFNEAE
jgi:hypothetical protein